VNDSAELDIKDPKLNRNVGVFAAVLVGSSAVNAVRSMLVEGHNSFRTKLVSSVMIMLVAIAIGRIAYVQSKRCRIIVTPAWLVVINPFRIHEIRREDVLGYRHRWLSKRTVTHVYMRGRWRALWLVGLPAGRVDELINHLEIPYTIWKPKS
jgi:hypothetical protein